MIGVNISLKKIQMLNPRTKSLSSFALSIYTNMDFDDNEFDYIENIVNSIKAQVNNND